MSTYSGPINPDPVDGDTRITIYSYIPSLAMGVVGVVTFGLVAIAHTYWATRYKLSRSFHILLAVGALMEVGGYIPRTLSHFHPFRLSYFVSQYFLIVVAPVLFTAAIYLSLSLVVKAVPGASTLLVLRPRTMLACFITADVVTTIIQVLGAALVGTSSSASARGNTPKLSVANASNILLAGLCIQAFSFICFLLILSIAIFRIKRYRQDDFNGYARSIKKLLWVIAVTSIFVLLRILFRLSADAQGFFGFANTREWLFAILEYLPIILALIIWASFPPGRYLSGGKEVAVGLTEKSVRPEDVSA